MVVLQLLHLRNVKTKCWLQYFHWCNTSQIDSFLKINAIEKIDCCVFSAERTVVYILLNSNAYGLNLKSGCDQFLHILYKNRVFFLVYLFLPRKQQNNCRYGNVIREWMGAVLRCKWDKCLYTVRNKIRMRKRFRVL